MSVFRHGARRFYHYDFQFKGERYHGSTGCTAKADANAFEAALRKQVASGAKVAAKLTVDQGLGLWWDAVGRFEASAKTTEGQLAHLARLLVGTTMMHGIGFAEVERSYIARRRGEKAKNRATLISNASVNRELEIAARVWKYVRENGYAAPYEGWRQHRLKEPKERTRELLPDEEDRLFEQLNPDLAAVAEFAMLSGQRRTAIITLLWSRVDLVGARATVRTKGSAKRSDVDHSFPLTPRMVEIIRSRPKVGPRVFTYQCERPAPARADRPRRVKGERYPFSVQGWTRQWRQALTDAKIDNFRFHDLRHTMATRVLRASKNLKAVQKLLNHADIATTARYAHALEDDLRDALAAADSAHEKAKSRHSPDSAVAETPESGGKLRKTG